ncbi:MAG: hypothetical protein QM497_04980, partial [Sulfurimonas sp.]
MESWMVSVGIGVATLIFGYGVFRNKITNIEESFRKHEKDDVIYHTDQNRTQSAQFKRLDTISERCVALEALSSNHLDMQEAEQKFVSKDELQLHLKNIELVTNHTNKAVEQIMGKQDELMKALSAVIFKQ